MFARDLLLTGSPLVETIGGERHSSRALPSCALLLTRNPLVETIGGERHSSRALPGCALLLTPSALVETAGGRVTVEVEVRRVHRGCR